VFGELGGVRVDDAANETNEEDAFAAVAEVAGEVAEDGDAGPLGV
jgi:hypothetical protein